MTTSVPLHISSTFVATFQIHHIQASEKKTCTHRWL